MLTSTVQRWVTRSLHWAARTVSCAIAIQLLFQDLIPRSTQPDPMAKHSVPHTSSTKACWKMNSVTFVPVCLTTKSRSVRTLGCVRVHLVHNLRHGCTRDTFHGLFNFGPCARPQARYEIPVGKGVNTSMKQGRRSSKLGCALVAYGDISECVAVILDEMSFSLEGEV